jgi:uncharacterized protein (UPF0335 family)
MGTHDKYGSYSRRGIRSFIERVERIDEEIKAMESAGSSHAEAA